MRVLVTGASSGIGLECVKLYMKNGFDVIGFDILPPSISGYEHHFVDISKPETYPDIANVDFLVNNAGVQDCVDDIEVNLKGTIKITERYGIHDGIKSILFVASASAHTGAEFPFYSASKGGMLSYMRNVAIRVSNYGATCNSLSPGGVKTELNRPVMDDAVLWNEIMAVTPLKRWAEPEEIATWIYFMTVINKSCTGEDILIDNGETRLNANFVWPEK